MKSIIIILVSVAISHVSALPLGDLFGRDLTDGLLDGDALSGLLDDTDILGGSGDLTSPVGDLLDPNSLDLGLFKRQLPGGDLTDGLLDGDALSGLLDDTDVLGDSGDLTSPIGDLLDPNALDLGLLKRQSFGLPGGDLTDGLLDGDEFSGLLGGTDVLGNSGDLTSPVGDLLDPNALDQGLAKRLLADALIKRGISILSIPGKRNILSNGIGGQTGTGVIGLAGNLQQIGSGVVAVGGAGASGHIGRDLGDGIGGQVGAGIVAAAGSPWITLVEEVCPWAVLVAQVMPAARMFSSSGSAEVVLSPLNADPTCTASR